MATRKKITKKVERIYYYTVGTQWVEEDTDLLFVDSTIVKSMVKNPFNERALDVLVKRDGIVLITNPEDIKTLEKNDETKVYISETGASMTSSLKADKERKALEEKNKELEAKLAALTKSTGTKKTTTTKTSRG